MPGRAPTAALIAAPSRPAQNLRRPKRRARRWAVIPAVLTRPPLRRAAQASSAQERVDESLGVEGGQVVGALPQAHELDGHAQLLLDGDHNPALGRAIELGEHNAGNADGLGEHLGLAHAVLTGGGVQDQEDLPHRGDLLHDALDLAQLVHEPGLVLQAPGGVHQDDVDAGVRGLLGGIVDHRGRVGVAHIGLEIDALGPRIDHTLGGPHRIRAGQPDLTVTGAADHGFKVDGEDLPRLDPVLSRRVGQHRHRIKRSLVILDEIGRGTSTFDGLSLAWAVAEELVRRQGGIRTLFATHYHELTALEERLPGLRNYNIAIREWKGEIVFLRRLVPGPADRSYGIEVARLAGVPAPVVARAKEILAVLERTAPNSGKRRELISRQAGLPGLGTTAPPREEMEENPVLTALRALNVNELSPLDALTLLHQWKDMAG